MQIAGVEAEFSRPTMYPGDQYPEGLPTEYARRLDHHYKRMKEEYCSKSGKPTISPKNYGRWCRTRASRTPVQLWELFSGSSRLSYLALLAGLTVAFPVDFRYGWNLGCREHQDMILDAQERLRPEVIVMSPSFSTWARPSSQQNIIQEELKELEAKAMQFVKVLACRQAEKGHGFLLEQPWTSPIWKHSVLATLQNDVADCRPRQRADQCCFGVPADDACHCLSRKPFSSERDPPLPRSPERPWKDAGLDMYYKQLIWSVSALPLCCVDQGH